MEYSAESIPKREPLAMDNQYAHLLRSSSEESLVLEPSHREKPVNDRRNTLNNRLFFWACVGTLCSTAMSLVLFARNVYYDFNAPSSTSVMPLRRPSTYINLDRVLAGTNHTFDPIINFPQTVYQIKTSDTKRRMTEDHRSWRAEIGTVYPDHRHIHVTPEISTIIQIRHIDHGMENCVLQTTLPEKTNGFDPDIRISPSSQLDIWFLESKTEISRHIGDTWKLAPQRTKKLTTISIDNLSGHTTQFKCPSNEFSTFELACSVTSAASDCSVSFWQDQRLRPAAGFYFMQHQSTPPPHATSGSRSMP